MTSVFDIRRQEIQGSFQIPSNPTHGKYFSSDVFEINKSVFNGPALKASTRYRGEIAPVYFSLSFMDFVMGATYRDTHTVKGGSCFFPLCT